MGVCICHANVDLTEGARTKATTYRAEPTILYALHGTGYGFAMSQERFLLYITHHCHSARASSNSSSANLLSSPPRRRPSLASRPIPRAPHAISEYIPVAFHALMRPSLERCAFTDRNDYAASQTQCLDTQRQRVGRTANTTTKLPVSESLLPPKAEHIPYLHTQGPVSGRQLRPTSHIPPSPQRIPGLAEWWNIYIQDSSLPLITP